MLDFPKKRLKARFANNVKAQEKRLNIVSKGQIGNPVFYSSKIQSEKIVICHNDIWWCYKWFFCTYYWVIIRSMTLLCPASLLPLFAIWLVNTFTSSHMMEHFKIDADSYWPTAACDFMFVAKLCFCIANVIMPTSFNIQTLTPLTYCLGCYLSLLQLAFINKFVETKLKVT